MTRSKGNFEYNYPRVIKFLKDNDIEFYEYAEGQHIKILGDLAYIELWPSRMTYHVIQSENVEDNRYRRLSIMFNPNELEEVLNGELKGREK